MRQQLKRILRVGNSLEFLALLPLMSCFTRVSSKKWAKIREAQFVDSQCSAKDIYFLNVIEFSGFVFDELDTFKMYKFAKNTGLINAVDSLTVQDKLRSQHFRKWTFQELHFPYYFMSCDYDYVVSLKNGRCFGITDIVTKKMKAIAGSEETVCAVYSYKVDGKKVQSNVLSLVR